MAAEQFHFEVLVRRTPSSGWSLHLALDDRDQALALGEELYAQGKVAAVRVTREILDPHTQAFKTVTLVRRGDDLMATQVRRASTTAEPTCRSLQDLYAGPARETLAEALEGWLRRHGATAFELLHSPKLADSLDRAGHELQHAIQKVAVAEFEQRGQPVHELIRTLLRLSDEALARLRSVEAAGAAPDLDRLPLPAAAVLLSQEPDRAFLLGVAISRLTLAEPDAREKARILLDLADAAPPDAGPRALCLVAIEQALADLFQGRGAPRELVGADVEPGVAIARLCRVVARDAVDEAVPRDPALAELDPAGDPLLARLSNYVAGGAALIETVAARRIAEELFSPRSLSPSAPRRELPTLRAVASAALSAKGRIIAAEKLATALEHRSRAAVSSHFVDLLMAACDGPLDQARALVSLHRQVAGAENARIAAQWLVGHVGSLKFETEILTSPDRAGSKLAALADLQRSLHGFEGADGVRARLGEIGALVESDSDLIAQVGRAPAPPLRKLSVLLRMAVGVSAPEGEAADRARAAALRLARTPDVHSALLASPEETGQLREMLSAIAAAAA